MGSISKFSWGASLWGIEPKNLKYCDLQCNALQVGRGKLTEPLKYEEWIDDKTKILKECDPHLDLMLFPDDDIEVI